MALCWQSLRWMAWPKAEVGGPRRCQHCGFSSATDSQAQVAPERSEGDFEEKELVPVHGLRGTGAPCRGT